MGMDLSFWRCKEGVDLPAGLVYQRACCDGQAVEGLEELPIDAIVREVEKAFPKWEQLDAHTYEKETGGSFQLFTTPQSFRVDCYGMNRQDMARISAILAGYGCPVYDPQQGVRFDRLAVSLAGEGATCREAVEEELTRLFPGLPFTIEEVPTPEGPVALPKPEHPVLEVFVHRGKSITKVTVNLLFGSGWTSRPTQCKTALLTNPEETKARLSKLAKTALGRAAEDMRQRSFYRQEERG